MKFNIRQEKVINAKDKNILCLAVAGSGKTTALIGRINRLLEDGCSPSSIVAFSFTNQAADEMKQRLKGNSEGIFIGTIHSYANEICRRANIKTVNDILNKDFDKIIEKAIKADWTFYPSVEFLFIDEFQDIDPIQYSFIKKIPAKNRFYIGDERQCQPAGTQIMLRNGIIKPIEEVKIGDSVVWYDNSKSYLSGVNINHNSIEKKVKKIASRDFCNDNIITIFTENGESSSYTPNHICYIRLKQSEYNHAVYLMCDEHNRFRVGKIPITTINSCHKNPWRDKMYKEGCCCIWILKSFKTDKEARALEQKISYKYSIPQTCWQLDKVKWEKEDIDYIYEGLNTYESAKRCLKDFNRDIDYPLLDKRKEKSQNIHYARNAVTEIYAANLMAENMEVIIYDNTEKHKKRYEKIKKIEYNYITKPIKVYSLEVEGGTYIADNIVTHNCIYTFRGSTDRYLREIATDNDFKKYYLTENYRTPYNIINFADDFLSQMEKLSPSTISTITKEGFLDNCSFKDAVEEITWTNDWVNWAILCRTNLEVEETKKYLDTIDIPNVIIRRGDLDLEAMGETLNQNMVKIMTVHASKGLEFPKVIAVGCRCFNAEESRICYVAATRAKEALYWCPTNTNNPKRNMNNKKKVCFKTNLEKKSIKKTIMF